LAETHLGGAMAVQDDLRRLSQLDSIYLGTSLNPADVTSRLQSGSLTSWYKGRLQQANDGSWIFRSVSSDGAVVGFQLGPANQGWASSETPSTGIVVTIPITVYIPPESYPNFACIFLQQQLPQELTN
jgi:hypothetical protein